MKERYIKERANTPNANPRIVAVKGATIQAATGGDGFLLVMLSGFRAEEGAPVLKLEATGQVTGAYRIPMTNAGSALIPKIWHSIRESYTSYQRKGK